MHRTSVGIWPAFWAWSIRWAVAGLGAVRFIAFAFASAGLAVATLMRELHRNQYVQLFMLPMFLFPATFYPLSIYPVVLRDVVTVLPLYQSTVLLRGLTLDQVGGTPAHRRRLPGRHGGRRTVAQYAAPRAASDALTAGGSEATVRLPARRCRA